ncbi:MAG: hypothetical protein H2069_07925 [Legionella sp.]|nr:hypothetical protein [Legionella sp.]
MKEKKSLEQIFIDIETKIPNPIPTKFKLNTFITPDEIREIVKAKSISRLASLFNLTVPKIKEKIQNDFLITKNKGLIKYLSEEIQNTIVEYKKKSVFEKLDLLHNKGFAKKIMSDLESKYINYSEVDIAEFFKLKPSSYRKFKSLAKNGKILLQKFDLEKIPQEAHTILSNLKEKNNEQQFISLYINNDYSELKRIINEKSMKFSQRNLLDYLGKNENNFIVSKLNFMKKYNLPYNRISTGEENNGYKKIKNHENSVNPQINSVENPVYSYLSDEPNFFDLFNSEIINKSDLFTSNTFNRYIANFNLIYDLFKEKLFGLQENNSLEKKITNNHSETPSKFIGEDIDAFARSPYCLFSPKLRNKVSELPSISLNSEAPDLINKKPIQELLYVDSYFGETPAGYQSQHFFNSDTPLSNDIHQTELQYNFK